MTIFAGIAALALVLWFVVRALDKREAISAIEDLRAAISDIERRIDSLTFRKHFFPRINLGEAQNLYEDALALFYDRRYADSARAAEAGLKYVDAIWAAVSSS